MAKDGKGFGGSVGGKGGNASISSNSVVKEGSGSHCGKRIDPEGGASRQPSAMKLPSVKPGN